MNLFAKWRATGADEFGDVVLRAYAMAVAQSLLLQDGIKVLLITLVSPQVAPSLLRPELNTKRARALMPGKNFLAGQLPGKNFLARHMPGKNACRANSAAQDIRGDPRHVASMQYRLAARSPRTKEEAGDPGWRGAHPGRSGCWLVSAEHALHTPVGRFCIAVGRPCRSATSSPSPP